MLEFTPHIQGEVRYGPQMQQNFRSLPVAKLEDMLVMHCMTNAVLEYQFYLKIPSTNCSAKRSYNKAYIC